MTAQSNQPPVENFPAVMSRLYSQCEDARIAALPEILKYGQLGKDLLIKIIETEKGALQEAAVDLVVGVPRRIHEQLTIELNNSSQLLNDVSKKIDEEISQLKLLINQLEQEIGKLEENRSSLKQRIDELIQHRSHEEAKEKEKIKFRMHEILKQREELEEKMKQTFSQLDISQSDIEQIYATQYNTPFQDTITTFMRLKSIISIQMEIESNKITLNTNFAHDLRADEVDSQELILAVEEEFDIEIPDEYIYNYTSLSINPDYTMKDIFEYIISHKKQNIEAI